MYKILFFFIFSFLFFPVIYTQSILDYSAYKEIWSEDFNGTMEDVEKNWRVGEYGWGNYNDHKHFSTSPFSKKHITFLSDKKNMSVSNGKMHMKNTMLKEYETKTICQDEKDKSTCTDYRVKYTFATMETTFGEIFGKESCDDIENDGGWMYGLFEVRCKVPINPLMFSTFWMIPAKAYIPEIDIFEFTHFCRKEGLFDGCQSKDFTNGIAPKFPGQKSAQFDHAFFKVGNDSFYDKYHTWSVLWTPEKLVFYLDGNEFRTWHGSLNGDGSDLKCKWRRMKIILTAKPTNMAHWPAYYNKFDPDTEFTIDYVKVYKPVNSKFKSENKLSLVAESIETVTPKNDINTVQQGVFYQSKQNEILQIAKDKTTNEWKKEKAFKSAQIDIRQDYIIGDFSGFYYLGKQKKIYHIYDTKESWVSKPIAESLRVKGPFKLGISDYRKPEIIYLAKNNTLNKLKKDNKTWTNKALYKAKLKTKNNFIVENNKVLFEHKNQLNIINSLDDLHTFSYSILDFKNNKKNKIFGLNKEANKIFYIDQYGKIRSHDFNELNNLWDENKALNLDIANAYDNLIVAENGNQLFYTDINGLIYSLTLNKTNWENKVLDKNIKIDTKHSVLAYDEVNKRLFFTSSYRNPTVFKRKTDGVIAYFEKNKKDNQWNYRKVLVLDNEANNEKKLGRVLENIHISENGTVFYVGKDKNIYAIYEPKKAHDIEYKDNTYVNGFR